MEVDGNPVWSGDGIIAAATALKDKDKVKPTFSHGASLPDPERARRGLEARAQFA